MDILKAREVQDFLPLTRGTYHDGESDEDLSPARRSCYRNEDEEEEQALQVFDPAKSTFSVRKNMNRQRI